MMNKLQRDKIVENKKTAYNIGMEIAQTMIWTESTEAREAGLTTENLIDFYIGFISKMQHEVGKLMIEYLKEKE